MKVLGAILSGCVGLSLLSSCASFLPKGPGVRTLSKGLAISQEDNGSSTRRIFGVQVAELLGVGAAFLLADPANAKGAQDLDAEKQKIYKGIQRLNYLLDNWVKETTVCGMNDNPYTGDKGCERTPVKVMEFMGYKSMDDPLFKADKTLRKLEGLIPPGSEADYLDAVEKWTEKADEASGMAFVSSWGEANPGGGKDRVEYFIERAKNDVIVARDSLVKAINIIESGSS
jgi:hypothetical protein